MVITVTLNPAMDKTITLKGLNIGSVNRAITVREDIGGKGGLFVTENGVYKCKGLKVPVKSTVGAGDSMVSAIVYSLINNYSDKETLRFATACGAASVALDGTQACTLQQVHELLKEVKCEIKEEF